MRVVCLRLISPTSGKEDRNLGWLTVDREYVILSILASPGRKTLVQVLADDGTPGWWDSEMFMTTSTRISSNWVATLREEGILEIGPSPWLRPGFWEDYFDQVPLAVDEFEREKELILQDERKVSTDESGEG